MFHIILFLDIGKFGYHGLLEDQYKSKFDDHVSGIFLHIVEEKRR